MAKKKKMDGLYMYTNTYVLCDAGLRRKDRKMYRMKGPHRFLCRSLRHSAIEWWSGGAAESVTQTRQSVPFFFPLLGHSLSFSTFPSFLFFFVECVAANANDSISWFLLFPSLTWFSFRVRDVNHHRFSFFSPFSFRVSLRLPHCPSTGFCPLAADV